MHRSRAQYKRVEALVAQEMGNDRMARTRRGMKHIWESIERDMGEQESLHLYKNNSVTLDYRYPVCST